MGQDSEKDREFERRVVSCASIEREWGVNFVNVAKECLRPDNAAAPNYGAISGPTKHTARLSEPMRPESSYLSFRCAGRYKTAIFDNLLHLPECRKRLSKA